MSQPSGNVGMATMSPGLVLAPVALLAFAGAMLAACSSPPPPAPTPLALAPSPTPALTSTPAPTPTPAPRVVLADNFDDPSKGRLPSASGNLSQSLFGYVEGEYQIKPGAAVAIPGTYANISVAFDARLVSGASESSVNIQCRRLSAAESWYVVNVTPQLGAVAANRIDNGTGKNLVPRQAWPAIRQGAETNHIEVNCVGITISARINGVEVLSVEDSTYNSGQVRLGATGVQATDVRIDNLVVTQH